MLTWVAVALAAGVALVIVRWVFRRYDSLGRARAFPVISVVLLSIAASAAGAPGILRWREERALERAASALVGFPVRVKCQSFGGAFVDTGAELGWVPFGSDGVPERETLIKYEPCDALRDYLRSDGSAPTYDQLVAVHVLTHEAMHMAGLAEESEAECAAVQRDAQMAELLGASPGDAALLAETYWQTVYPRMPDGYRTGDCRDGGKLDERLPLAPWVAGTAG